MASLSQEALRGRRRFAVMLTGVLEAVGEYGLSRCPQEVWYSSLVLTISKTYN
jgi:hypothetical protein